FAARRSTSIAKGQPKIMPPTSMMAMSRIAGLPVTLWVLGAAATQRALVLDAHVRRTFAAAADGPLVIRVVERVDEGHGDRAHGRAHCEAAMRASASRRRRSRLRRALSRFSHGRCDALTLFLRTVRTY